MLRRVLPRWPIACVQGCPRVPSEEGSDNTVRLWRCDTWQPVAVVPESASAYWPPGVAFHPHAPLLATVGSDPDAKWSRTGDKENERDTLIHLWQLDLAVLLGEAEGVPTPSGVRPDIEGVQHTTAKIVLVGDSGAGKTGLGWRMAHGEFKHHPSTHGQQFWVLDQLEARRGDGTNCEAVAVGPGRTTRLPPDPRAVSRRRGPGAGGVRPHQQPRPLGRGRVLASATAAAMPEDPRGRPRGSRQFDPDAGGVGSSTAVSARSRAGSSRPAH